MKKLMYPCLLILTTLLSMSFLTKEATPLTLANTKWISPTNDNCYSSICFTSENTVMLYRCDDQWYYEVGYAIKGNNIEIEAYSNEAREQTGKLILCEVNGVLRQLSGQINTFPKNYILVPAGSCN